VFEVLTIGRRRAGYSHPYSTTISSAAGQDWHRGRVTRIGAVAPEGQMPILQSEREPGSCDSAGGNAGWAVGHYGRVGSTG
jgi:hypothetical protein